MKFKNVFSPIQIGQMTVKNRMVVPPMGTNFATRQGFVTQQLLDYYEARAKGGFGLIEIEVTAVVPQGRSIPNEVGVWSDEHIEGLTKLAGVIHKHGAKTIVQLHHAGRQTFTETINDEVNTGLQIEAPSPISCPFCNVIPREMTTQDCYDMIHKFADAAVRVQKAGFDGVQLHCTHGYLLAQFMSRHSNKRTDEFGGGIAGRMKMPLDIIKEIRAKCGNGFVITVRFTGDEKYQDGIETNEAKVFGKMFEEAGVNGLHVSVSNYGSLPYMSVPGYIPAGYNVYTAEEVKKTVSIPVCTVGKINDPYLAENIIASGSADLVAFGRESICEPAIPNKMAGEIDEEISPCISCEQSCHGYLFGPHKTISCLVNPFTGNEGKYNLASAPVKKKVMVVGGGPAGMFAAWVAAARGHEVSLYDEREQLGGEFRIAAIPPSKQAITKVIKYYKKMCDKYGVEIHCGIKVDEALMKEIAPDVILLATGSKPLFPSIPGLKENEKTTAASPVLEGKVNYGNKILIAGGGAIAAETAEFLGERGKKITMVEMKPEIATDVHPFIRPFLLSALEKYKVDMITNATIKSFTKDGIVYEKNGREVIIEGFDNTIVALGTVSNNPFEEVAKTIAKEVFVIGDAVKAGQANAATESALEAAATI